MGDIVQKYGIYIATEHLNKAESNIINTFEENVKFAKDVNHDSIKCLIDYYHFSVGNESLNSIKTGVGYIKHAHFASTLERRIAIYESGSEYGKFFNNLSLCGFPDRISIEAYSNDIKSDAEKGYNFLNRLLSAYDKS